MARHLPTVGVIVVLTGLAAAVGWYATRSGAAAPVARSGSASAAVEVEPVRSATLRDIRTLTGTLEASSSFTVAAKVGGLLERVLVDLGDRVERGQIVAEIDDAEFVQAVAQAEADLAVRKAELARAASDLTLAEREYERSEQLRARGIAAESQVDEVNARLESGRAAQSLAQAQVARAEAALELARINLGYTKVRATWTEGTETGLVGQRFLDPGNTMSANGQVISIVQTDPLKAVVFVTERDYAGMRTGQTATITSDTAPGASFVGTVERIAPVFNESSRQARVELRVPNPDNRLRPGNFVRVRIVLREAESACVVPSAAVARRDGREVVFVLDDGSETVRMVPVSLGVAEGELVEILDPVITGRVITLGQQLLEDGMKVRVVAAEASSEGAASGATP